MPQASESTIKRAETVFGVKGHTYLEEACHRHLRDDMGYKCIAGVWQIPQKDTDPINDSVSAALRYLMEEWDYGFDIIA
jgi:hypothetical protein